MTKIKATTKSIGLSFDLSKYLMDKPEIASTHNSDNYVIFTERKSPLNKRSQVVLSELLDNGKKVIKATRRDTSRNYWKFEYITS